MNAQKNGPCGPFFDFFSFITRAFQKNYNIQYRMGVRIPDHAAGNPPPRIGVFAQETRAPKASQTA
jgi:hypothetical protein